jgi:hypothetical protein
VTILATPGSGLSLQFTTSGSFSFSVARDDIIRQAMLNHALLEQSEIPTAQEITDCARVLNMIVKQLAGQLDRAPGFKMWQRLRGDLFLSYSKFLYNLAGNASGDAWAGGVTGLSYPNLYNQDQLVSGLAPGTTIWNVGPFPTPLAVNINDYVGVQYTTPAGYTDIWWTTITGINPSAGTITVAQGLPTGSAAQATAYVWNYTTKAQRPMKVLTALLRDSTYNDTPLTEMTLEQYEALPTKTMPSNVADPTAWYYEARMLQNNGHLYTDCAGAQDVTKHIHAVFLRQAMDFNNPGDAPEFPQEYFWHLSWMLSLGICSMFDCDWTPDKQLAFGLATTNAREGNPQTTAMYFQPEDEDSF